MGVRAGQAVLASDDRHDAAPAGPSLPPWCNRRLIGTK